MSVFNSLSCLTKVDPANSNIFSSFPDYKDRFSTCCHVTVNIDRFISDTLAVRIDPVDSGIQQGIRCVNFPARPENGVLLQFLIDIDFHRKLFLQWMLLILNVFYQARDKSLLLSNFNF